MKALLLNLRNTWARGQQGTEEGKIKAPDYVCLLIKQLTRRSRFVN